MKTQKLQVHGSEMKLSKQNEMLLKIKKKAYLMRTRKFVKEI